MSSNNLKNKRKSITKEKNNSPNEKKVRNSDRIDSFFIKLNDDVLGYIFSFILPSNDYKKNNENNNEKEKKVEIENYSDYFPDIYNLSSVNKQFNTVIHTIIEYPLLFTLKSNKEKDTINYLLTLSCSDLKLNASLELKDININFLESLFFKEEETQIENFFFKHTIDSRPVCLIIDTIMIETKEFMNKYSKQIARLDFSKCVLSFMKDLTFKYIRIQNPNLDKDENNNQKIILTLSPLANSIIQNVKGNHISTVLYGLKRRFKYVPIYFITFLLKERLFSSDIITMDFSNSFPFIYDFKKSEDYKIKEIPNQDISKKNKVTVKFPDCYIFKYDIFSNRQYFFNIIKSLQKEYGNENYSNGTLMSQMNGCSYILSNFPSSNNTMICYDSYFNTNVNNMKKYDFNINVNWEGELEISNSFIKSLYELALIIDDTDDSFNYNTKFGNLFPYELTEKYQKNGFINLGIFKRLLTISELKTLYDYLKAHSKNFQITSVVQSKGYYYGVNIAKDLESNIENMKNPENFINEFLQNKDIRKVIRSPMNLKFVKEKTTFYLNYSFSLSSKNNKTN
jgi:hypothetical protein